MSTPTFFLVGAPKAGTTSLFRYLGAHPDVAVSAIKEPCFFAPEVPVDPETDAHRRNWDTYRALFAHAGRARAIGEGSVAYLSAPNAAAAIRARIPHAKIVMMLRDPADRLFAHYSAAIAAGVTTAPFPKWVDDQQQKESDTESTWGPVWAGRYATHLARFKEHFPADQLHVSYYDDFVTEPDAVLARLFSFLGVDASVAIDREERHNVTTVTKWPALDALRPPMRALFQQMLPTAVFDRARAWSREPAQLTFSRVDRAHAIAVYREEIEALQRLTGRDLARWLSA